jgi:hypothetical protein
MDDIVLNLISNASKSHRMHPSNTTARFTTVLMNPIELYGEYEMGLKEIVCPISFYNIAEGCSVDVRYGTVDSETSLSADTYEVYDCPPGNYSTIHQLLGYLNSVPLLVSGFQLQYDERSGHVEVLNSGNFNVQFSPKLRSILGFTPNQAIVSGQALDPIKSYKDIPIKSGECTVDLNLTGKINYDLSSTTVDKPKDATCKCLAGNYANIHHLLSYLNSEPLSKSGYKLSYNETFARVEVESIGKGNIDFSPKLRAVLGFAQDQPILKGPALGPVNLYANVPQQLLIYCDVVETQMVGDGESKLLRNIGIEDITKFGHLFIKTYDNPDYFPVSKKSFGSIKIDISTLLGQPAPFVFGPSLVKVHFRRRSL